MPCNSMVGAALFLNRSIPFRTIRTAALKRNRSCVKARPFQTCENVKSRIGGLSSSGQSLGQSLAKFSTVQPAAEGHGVAALHPARFSSKRQQTSTEESGATPGVLDLTDGCVKRLREVCGEGERLRVTVESGGCSGFQYKFALDSKVNEDDVVIEREGASLVVDTLTLDMIKGAKIDYTEELIRSSFEVVNNPQAEAGCSCGVSFAIKF